MYIYIYIYIYTYTYMYACVCIHIYTCISESATAAGAYVLAHEPMYLHYLSGDDGVASGRPSTTRLR